MKIAKLLGGFFLAAIAFISCKKEDNSNINNALNDADNKFILLAGLSNSSETETAKIAVSKTADSLVLSFAQQMLSEHTRAQSDLKTMSAIVGFTVKDTIDTAHTTTVTLLNTLTGRAFDSAYIHTQLSHHQGTIIFYTDEIKNGRQMNVQAYANTNLQNIRLHYQRADSIATAFY